MIGRSDEHLLGQLASALLGSHGCGQPLHPQLQSWLGHGLATDLSAIRVHTGPAAIRLASLLNAYAFTSGRDIYFAAGHYRPDTAAGRYLVAHEVAHVIQQARGDLPARRFRGRPGDRYEKAADELALRLLVGMPVEPADRGVAIPAAPNRPLAVQC